ncbi:MAG: Fic family protein [Acidimicrobiales bacterium]
MRSLRGNRLDLVPADVVAALGRIDRASGAEATYLDQLPQLLQTLRGHARVESVTASNAIEGVVVEPSRVPRLLDRTGTRLRNRSEEEFAGYRAALDYLHQDDPSGLSVGLVLHLHRLLFSFANGSGGSFKADDNLVVDRATDGSRRVRFTPISARETPFFVEELVLATREALDSGRQHPLIVVAAFALDLLCIHPFADGNGRVGRLATTHLLAQTGYTVGRYVSLEQLIYDTREGYYESLGASTDGWFDDGQHDVWPWVRYLLHRLDDAYDRFAARVAAGRASGSKQQRVRDYVLAQAPATFTIGDVRRAVPGVSDNTIRLVLTALRDEHRIYSDGTGRSAAWRRTG